MAFVCALLSCFALIKPNNQQNTAAEAFVLNTENNIVEELYYSEATLASSYDLSKIYPLSCENQTRSDFCWLYSSSKALETAFMVQKQEYYNVSEIGMAYMYFRDRIDDSDGSEVAFSISGNYYNYVDIMQKHGLIAESDCSNDLFGQINYENFEKFDYISEYADTEIASQIDAYSLSDNALFSSTTQEAQIKIIKNYLMTYGGLFAGLGPGVFYINGNKSYYTDDLTKEGDDAYQMEGYHALCLVGWDDSVVIDGVTGGFLLMNSWGIEPVCYEYFYVSYAYEYLYETLGGFVFNDEEPIVKTNESSASSFKTKVYPLSNLNNVFCYGDAMVAVDYKLNIESLDMISVKVSSGRVDYTNKFKIMFDNESKLVTVYLIDDDEFYGGYYSIKFYSAGSFLCQKGIYVYSATEIGYFNVQSSQHLDSYALMNSYLVTNNNATLYISSKTNYYMYFNLTSMTEYYKLYNVVDGFSFNYSIINASALSSSNAAINNYSSEYIISRVFATHTGDEYYTDNEYFISLTNLNEFENCFLSFSIKIDSLMYKNVSRIFNIDAFISSRAANYNSSTFTDDLNGYYINYELDGGMNNADNITMMPDYVIDSAFPSIELKEPSKAGYEFVGWYLNPSYSGGAVTSISKSMISNVDSGVLSLYAKWQSTELDYFEMTAGFDGATDYEGESKEIADGLVYGDSVAIKFNFIELPDLRVCDYTVLYFFYVNGVVADSQYLANGSQEVVFNVRFPQLVSGDYLFKVKITVVIDNAYTKEEEVSMSCTVEKKLVEFEFSDLVYVYDGQPHKPTVSVKENSFYEEDLQGVELSSLYNISDSTGKINASTYNYSITSLNNNNYYFVSNDAKCSMVINKKAVSVSWAAYDATYDTERHLPQYTVNGVVGTDSVTFDILDVNYVYAGTYETNIKPETISNSNYYVVMGPNFEYTIKKHKITIAIDSATDRFQARPENRVKPTYRVFGGPLVNRAGVEDDLGVVIINEADHATTSGKYKIDCTISNANYEATVVTGVYTLTGYYKIYYHLPSGEVYIETINEGELPKGVTEDEMELEMFTRLKYSQALENLSEDVHITVEVEDYSGQVFIIVFGAIFVGLCLLVYFKKRKTGVR